MRELYTQQLTTMKTRLIQMGAMCEDAISCSVKGMLHGDAELLKKVESTELDINQMEREIERLCMRLLLMQQPVASDLRSVSSALKIISDLERIGDQAYDIAEIAKHLKYSEFAGKVHIQDMAVAAIRMVTDSVEAFVQRDLELAQKVLKEDDTVDQLFNKVRADLIHMIRAQEEDVEMVLDCEISGTHRRPCRKCCRMGGLSADGRTRLICRSATGIRRKNREEIQERDLFFGR